MVGGAVTGLSLRLHFVAVGRRRRRRAGRRRRRRRRRLFGRFLAGRRRWRRFLLVQHGVERDLERLSVSLENAMSRKLKSPPIDKKRSTTSLLPSLISILLPNLVSSLSSSLLPSLLPSLLSSLFSSLLLSLILISDRLKDFLWYSQSNELPSTPLDFDSVLHQFTEFYRVSH